jgi:hypothetical protein
MIGRFRFSLESNRRWNVPGSRNCFEPTNASIADEQYCRRRILVSQPHKFSSRGHFPFLTNDVLHVECAKIVKFILFAEYI